MTDNALLANYADPAAPGIQIISPPMFPQGCSRIAWMCHVTANIRTWPMWAHMAIYDKNDDYIRISWKNHDGVNRQKYYLTTSLTANLVDTFIWRNDIWMAGFYEPGAFHETSAHYRGSAGSQNSTAASSTVMQMPSGMNLGHRMSFGFNSTTAALKAPFRIAFESDKEVDDNFQITFRGSPNGIFWLL